jgi:ketosteroid isomerase-like protein
MPEDRKRAMRQLYESFNRGDIEPAINAMSQDVTWDAPGMAPFVGRRMGRDQFRQFFAEAMKAVQIDQFDVDDVLADGDKVAVLGRQRATVRQTGRDFLQHWAHVYIFRGGKIADARLFGDSHPVASKFGRFDQGAGGPDGTDGHRPPGDSGRPNNDF